LLSSATHHFQSRGGSFGSGWSKNVRSTRAHNPRKNPNTKQTVAATVKMRCHGSARLFVTATISTAAPRPLFELTLSFLLSNEPVEHLTTRPIEV
jgi:hypothetical protein